MNAWMAWTAWFKRSGPRKARRNARRVPRDFADYGTAFGLDMSLAHEAGKSNESERVAAPRAAAPARAVAAPMVNASR